MSLSVLSELQAKEVDLHAVEAEITHNQKNQRSLTYKNDLLQKRARVLRLDVIRLREQINSGDPPEAA